MLYRIGTEREIASIESKLPYPVLKALLKSTVLLGPDRDYLASGGYSLIAETKEDVDAIRNTIDFSSHPCEWADRFEDYVSALYLLNDDFSVVLFMPLTIAPDIITKEMEDPK